MEQNIDEVKQFWNTNPLLGRNKSNSCVLCGEDNFVTLIEECRDYEYNVPWKANLVKCLSCGLVSTSPLPIFDELELFYPPDYANYGIPNSSLSKLLSHLYAMGERRKLKNILNKKCRILDVGCGSGSYLDSLCNTGHELHGTEFSEEAAEISRKKGHIVHVGELQQLHLESNFFDVVRLNHVLEHVIDPVSTLCEIRRIIKIDGFVIIETPNTDCIDFSIFSRYWGALHFPRHIHLFSASTMGNLCERCGFKISTLRYTLMPTGWSMGIQNLLVDKFHIGLKNGRMKFYQYLMLAVMPIVLLQRVFSKNTMMQVVAKTHPTD